MTMIHSITEFRPDMTKEEKLFQCAFRILLDQCPENPRRYLCRESDEYDEEACLRCWSDYLFDVVNGRI